MKLYTEDQVRKAYNGGCWDGYNNAKGKENDTINALLAIELPSDEEIGKEMDKLPFEKHVDDGLYNDGVLDGFELGTQWMRDHIKNQINQHI